MNTQAPSPTASRGDHHKIDPFRFHKSYEHLVTTFGNGWFALKAESFARFFGTPFFLGIQTFAVILWIAANSFGLASFDIYPFILLNLAFSVQSAYAAPLILLAQTRQAERDKANAEADAQHREEIAMASKQMQEIAVQNMEQLLVLMRQNTELTKLTNKLSSRIESLTEELHAHIIKADRQQNISPLV